MTSGGSEVRLAVTFERDTARLRLRRPVADDIDAYLALHSDPRTYAHAPASMPDPDHCRTRLASDLDDWERDGYGYLAVDELDTGRVIGWGGVKPTKELPALNLYYRLSHDVLGRGYGRELARAVVAAAVESVPDRFVRAIVKPHNLPSLRTAESAGLVAVGTERHPEDGPDDAPSVVLEAPRLTSLYALDEATREDLLDVWVRVNDAGGAVGFLPGAPRTEVARAIAVHEAAMSEGRSVLGILREPGGAVIAFGWWEVSERPMARHVATLWRFMVDPGAQGRNTGRLMLAGMHAVARSMTGVELLSLDYRSGLGLGDFYARSGWVETGRLPRVIRVGPDDDRDGVLMMRRADGTPLTPDGRT